MDSLKCKLAREKARRSKRNHDGGGGEGDPSQEDLGGNEDATGPAADSHEGDLCLTCKPHVGSRYVTQ